MVRSPAECAFVNIYSFFKNLLSVNFLLPSTCRKDSVSMFIDNVVSFVADFPIQSNYYVFIIHCKKPLYASNINVYQ